MIQELIVTVSTGRKAHVTFQNRQVGREVRLVCDVAWEGESTGEEREELGLAVQSLIAQQFGGIRVTAEAHCVESQRERDQITKRHLGIGDN